MKNITKIILCIVFVAIAAGLSSNTFGGVSASYMFSGPSYSGPSYSGPSYSGPSNSGPFYDECALNPASCGNHNYGSCGTPCFADHMCGSGYACDMSNNSFVGSCVLAQCVNGGATCSANKCSIISTPTPTPRPPKRKACEAKAGDPGVVAYYEDGRHEIAGRPNILHFGKDIVMKTVHGFEQCFMGTANGAPSSVYSYWRNVGKANNCPAGQILIQQAYPQWGDHMEPGANYCVRNVDF